MSDTSATPADRQHLRTESYTRATRTTHQPRQELPRPRLTQPAESTTRPPHVGPTRLLGQRLKNAPYPWATKLLPAPPNGRHAEASVTPRSGSLYWSSVRSRFITVTAVAWETVDPNSALAIHVLNAPERAINLAQFNTPDRFFQSRVLRCALRSTVVEKSEMHFGSRPFFNVY